MNTSSNASGFTLIELLFTVAVAAILSMIALPGLHGTITRTRLASAHNTLIGSLHQARALAVSRGVPSIVCPSRDQHHCQPSQGWHGGWLVASDADRDGQPDGQPARVYGAQSGELRIIGSRGRLQVRFLPSGASPGSNVSLILCRAGQPDSARSVVLSNPGRARSGTPSPAQAVACSQS